MMIASMKKSQKNDKVNLLIDLTNKIKKVDGMQAKKLNRN